MYDIKYYLKSFDLRGQSDSPKPWRSNAEWVIDSNKKRKNFKWEELKEMFGEEFQSLKQGWHGKYILYSESKTFDKVLKEVKTIKSSNFVEGIWNEVKIKNLENIVLTSKQMRPIYKGCKDEILSKVIRYKGKELVWSENGIMVNQLLIDHLREINNYPHPINYLDLHGRYFYEKYTVKEEIIEDDE